jgi:hypothetical protein
MLLKRFDEEKSVRFPYSWEVLDNRWFLPSIERSDRDRITSAGWNHWQRMKRWTRADWDAAFWRIRCEHVDPARQANGRDSIEQGTHPAKKDETIHRRGDWTPISNFFSEPEALARWGGNLGVMTYFMPFLFWWHWRRGGGQWVRKRLRRFVPVDN